MVDLIRRVAEPPATWRRASVAVAAAAVLLAGTPAVAQPANGDQAPADAWPQFRGAPALTGRAGAPLPASLGLLWELEAGEVVESSAAIAEGVVYVGTQLDVGNGELLALDLETGAVRWRVPVPEGVGESSPAVTGGRVFVGSLAGVLHAFDAEDGTPLWTFETGSEIRSSPVVAGDRVLIGSYDAHLYGLDAATGRLAWKVGTDNYVHGTPAVLGDIAYFAGCDEVLRGVRVSDGTLAVTLAFGAYTGASVALDGDRAFFGTFDNEVIGVDLGEGDVAWRYEHPARRFPFYSSAALADGKVIVGGRDRMVHAIDAATGEPVWTFMTQARVDSSPAVAGGRVYVGSHDGRLYALDLASGREVWQYHAGAGISASPAIAAGRVVVGTHDGRILCFG